MQYSNYDMKNNVHATLSTAVSSVATTIQLTSGQGSRFGTTFPQIATLESFDENGKVIKREIVKITGRSGDNLTVVRAFAPCPENDDANSQTQNAISFNADDTISLYIPKEIFDKISDSLNDIYDNGTNNMRTEIVSGLQVQVNPGNVMVGSAYYDFAGGTITLTDNATNYLEIDEDGLLVSNTTARNDGNTKLAIITTSSGSVTNIKDRRLGTIGGKIGGVNIHDLTAKTNIVGTDEFILSDSENIYNNKKVSFSDIEKSFKIDGLTEKSSSTGDDILLIGDSENSFQSKKIKVSDFVAPSISLSYWGGSGPYSNGIFANYNKEYFMFYSTSNRVEVYNKRGLFVVAVPNRQYSYGNLVMGDYVYSCESGGFKRILISNFLQMNFNSPERVINTGSGLDLFLGFDGQYLIFMNSSRKIIRYDLNFNLVDNSFTAPNYTYHSMNFITAKHYIFQSSSSPYQMYIYDKTYNLIGTYQRDTSNMFYTVYNGIAYLFQKPTSSSFSKLWTPIIGL